MRAREALLHGENYQVHVRYRNRFGRERSYTSGFEGVIPFIKRRHAETESDWSRERYEGYMREVPCPACGGARLKPEVLAVRIGDKSIAQVCALPVGECADVPRAADPRRAPGADRRRRAQGDQRPARLPARRRARLPLPRPPCGHAVRRRGAADPAGHPDRVRAGRGAVRARRAEHRPAPARQPAADLHADPAARPGQHPDRGRARRGHHRHGRLGRRHRPGCRRARRPRRALGLGRGPAEAQDLAHRPVPVRARVDRRSRSTGACPTPTARSPSSGRASTTCAASTSRSRSGAWSRSPASPARASPRW